MAVEAVRRAGGRPVKVFTIASAGWGEDQELVWLRKYFQEHRADLVLEWITPVNDLFERSAIRTTPWNVCHPVQ